ncbi:immunity protein Imm33 domain-containing protein [Arthrobacter sp. MMS24-S77]
MTTGIDAEQLKIVARFGLAPHLPLPGEKCGVARNVRDGLWPLNGLRHPAAGDTCGWYFWAGEELSTSDDFFASLHVEHLADWCPAVLPYLGLGPGWRFLIAPGYEDVWFDESLLLE